MAVEQDTLSRYAPGPNWSVQALVPTVPVFSKICPKLAKIAPDEAVAYDSAWKKWEVDFVARLTRGALPS